MFTTSSAKSKYKYKISLKCVRVSTGGVAKFSSKIKMLIHNQLSISIQYFSLTIYKKAEHVREILK